MDHAVHPSWSSLISGWQEAGLVRTLARSEVADLLALPANSARIAELFRCHYGCPNPEERAWRIQPDRYLELPEGSISALSLAALLEVVLPEERVLVDRTAEGLTLRMTAADGRGAPVSIFVRRVRKHARTGRVFRIAGDELPSRTLVYTLNMLLSLRNSELRFVPVCAIHGRRAWVATTHERAEKLAALYALAPDERWEEFTRFQLPLAIAS